MEAVEEPNDIQQFKKEEEKYRAERLVQFADYANINPYPHYFEVDTTFSQYIDLYKDVEIGSRITDKIHRLAGRVIDKRNAGKNLFFFKVRSGEDGGHALQFLADRRVYEDKDQYRKITKLIHRGDHIGVRGFVGKSNTGELSIYPLELVLLSPCLKFLPNEHIGLTNPEVRSRKRYLDLVVNPGNRYVLLDRANIIREIRRYLDDHQFVEVQTPTISTKVGGAAAKPFITHHNELKQDMYLRVAPELKLKELIVSGYNRVYELGQQFRNEGIDRTHNPEFTSLEFYMAYADYNVLMKMCEEMLSAVVMKIKGTMQFQYSCIVGGGTKTYDLDFTPPYKVIDIIPELRRCGLDIPDNLSDEKAATILEELCKKHGVECSPPRTTTRLLDKLISEYIEPRCINPTFLINHPSVMSPLAKPHRENSQLSERFELFVSGFELTNAYTELNDPKIQREKFLEQQKDRDKGDDEAHGIDEEFIEAMEYGLPPTGGFGMGVDRFVMLLTNRDTIKDVIAFPSNSNLSDLSDL